MSQILSSECRRFCKDGAGGICTEETVETSPTKSSSFFVSERLVATRHCADRRFLYLIFEDNSARRRPQRVSKKEAFRNE